MAEQDEAQFQADLKRALELSLETAAQDDARRDCSVGGSGPGKNNSHLNDNQESPSLTPCLKHKDCVIIISVVADNFLVSRSQ